MEKVNMAEARRRFKELVDRAAAGETILIARDGQTFARLVPANDETRPKPKFDAEKVRQRLEGQTMDPRSAEEIEDELRSLDRY